MRQDSFNTRLILSALVIGLALGEAFPAFWNAIYGSFDPSYLITDRLVSAAEGVLIMFVAPLAIILCGLLYSEELSIVGILAAVVIGVGSVVIYALRIGDGTGGVLKILSVLVYWVAALLTLVLLGRRRNGEQ